MPIDPSIPLGFRAPEPVDYNEIQAKRLQLEAMKRQNRMGKLQETQTQQSMWEEQQFKDALQRGADRGELYGISPKLAATWDKSELERRKADLETQEKQFDLTSKKSKRLSEIVFNVKDQPTLHSAIGQALSEGLIDANEATTYLQQPWNEQTAQHLQAIGQRAMTVAEQNAAAAAKVKADREAALFPSQLAESQAKAKTAQQTADGKTPITPYQQAELDRKATPNTPAELAFVANNHRSTPEQRAQAKAALRELELHAKASRPVVNVKGGGEAGGNSSLAQAVIDNPALWDNLTPSARTQIAPQLAKAGFSGFGKPLNESAISKMAESKSAVASLRDLRQTLLDNEQYIGPISGVQAMNPWSDARKAQAKIDLVKQRVGKALEGGVLRKEDEEKYKRILATLQDTPSTAIAKVDNIIQTLERDLDLYVNEQRSAGRRMPEPAKAGRVKMLAPNGQMKEVDASEVSHYESLGAKRVR